jgi:hypothetical protein
MIRKDLGQICGVTTEMTTGISTSGIDKMLPRGTVESALFN